MRPALLVLALLLSGAAARGDDTPDYQVEVNPKTYDTGDFAGKDRKASELPARRKRPDALPEKRDREEAFARVPGLAGDIAGMDELDRDLLYMRAKSRTLPELRKLYPKISAPHLTRLKKECGN